MESFWNNNDALLVGRVPKGQVLERNKWEFWAGDGRTSGDAVWSLNETDAVRMFSTFCWPHSHDFRAHMSSHDSERNCQVSVMNYSLMIGMQVHTRNHS